MAKILKRATVSMAAASVAAGSVAMSADPVAAQATAPRASTQLSGAADAGVDNFSRNRNTSVQQRSRPDYEAPGVRAGAFLIYPRLEVSVARDDNIFASETNEVDDTIVRVRPEVVIESNWSQNFLSAYARGSFNQYDDNSDEDTEEYGVGTAGRIDVSRRSNVGFGADYARSFEPRTAPTAPRNAVSPVSVDTTQLYVSASRSAGYI